MVVGRWTKSLIEDDLASDASAIDETTSARMCILHSTKNEEGDCGSAPLLLLLLDMDDDVTCLVVLSGGKKKTIWVSQWFLNRIAGVLWNPCVHKKLLRESLYPTWIGYKKQISCNGNQKKFHNSPVFLGWLFSEFYEWSLSKHSDLRGNARNAL